MTVSTDTLCDRAAAGLAGLADLLSKEIVCVIQTEDATIVHLKSGESIEGRDEKAAAEALAAWMAARATGKRAAIDHHRYHRPVGITSAVTLEHKRIERNLTAGMEAMRLR